jgi:hypothetical protein
MATATKIPWDNAGSVYQKLAALGPRLRKSQFETTPEFQARIRLLLEAIKIGPNRTANDRLSFVHPYGDETTMLTPRYLP